MVATRTFSPPLAIRLSRALRVLPASGWLRHSCRWLQTWGHYAPFRAWHRLLAAPALRPLVHLRPRLAYTYLVPNLAHGLSRATRLRILHGHYAYWLQHARPDFFYLVTRSHELWHCQVQGQRYSIALAYPEESDVEGELALRFYADTTCLYTLTFTLVSAGALPSLVSPAILVSRVQGTPQYDLIRQATKHLHECLPSVLLLQALRGLSQACGIMELLGVGTRAQLCHHNAAHRFDYDLFWQQAGAELLHPTSPFYGLHWLRPEKPLTALKAHHRARTARKRGYKQQLRTSVQRYVAQHLLHAGNWPVDTGQVAVGVVGNSLTYSY